VRSRPRRAFTDPLPRRASRCARTVTTSRPRGIQAMRSDSWSPFGNRRVALPGQQARAVRSFPEDATPVTISASVVIRALNEARTIGQTLTAIFHPDALPPVDVIVVDSGSTDGTQDIALRFPVRLLHIRRIDFTYGFALNLGVVHARGEVVATLSAHSLPASPDWLRYMLQPFANPRVAGVYCRQLPRADATVLERLGMRMTGLLEERPKLLDRQPLFSNANGAFRRSQWAVCPFNETVAGAEDVAWARAMQARGYLIAYEPRAAVYHSHAEPWRKHLQRTARDAPTLIGSSLGVDVGRLLTSRSAPTGSAADPSA
jgi:rhamnosyltransferase